MIKIILMKNELSKDEKDFFEKMNPGFSVTGDVLCLYSDDGSGENMRLDMLDSTRKLLTL